MWIDLDSLMARAPRNESKEHFLLKHVGRIYFWQRGFRIVGQEIYGLRDWRAQRDCVDVLAVGERKIGEMKMLCSKAIEVKVSRSDFKSGFCKGADFTSILCPKGMIDPDELPQGVGLIEADIDRLRIKVSGIMELEGVEAIKKAQYNKTAFGIERIEDHQRYIHSLVHTIAAQNTRELARFGVPEELEKGRD